MRELAESENCIQSPLALRKCTAEHTDMVQAINEWLESGTSSNLSGPELQHPMWVVQSFSILYSAMVL